MAEPTRNFMEEAARIAQGDQSVLPQREHLIAMAGQVQSVTSNLQFTMQLLAALMVDGDEPVLHFPAGLLKAVASRFMNLRITKLPDGSAVVEDVADARIQPGGKPARPTLN